MVKYGFEVGNGNGDSIHSVTVNRNIIVWKIIDFVW